MLLWKRRRSCSCNYKCITPQKDLRLRRWEAVCGCVPSTHQCCLPPSMKRSEVKVRNRKPKVSNILLRASFLEKHMLQHSWFGDVIGVLSCNRICHQHLNDKRCKRPFSSFLLCKSLFIGNISHRSVTSVIIGILMFSCSSWRDRQWLLSLKILQAKEQTNSSTKGAAEDPAVRCSYCNTSRNILLICYFTKHLEALLAVLCWGFCYNLFNKLDRWTHEFTAPKRRKCEI